MLNIVITKLIINGIYNKIVFMKTVRITEGQLKTLQLIKEGEDFSSIQNEKLVAINKNIDKLYSSLMFSTLAEFRDGETDLSIMNQQAEVLSEKISNVNGRILDFYGRFSDEETDAKGLGDVRADLEDKWVASQDKLWVVEQMIEGNLPIALNQEWHTRFSNITPTEIK